MINRDFGAILGAFFFSLFAIQDLQAQNNQNQNKSNRRPNSFFYFGRAPQAPEPETLEVLSKNLGYESLDKAKEDYKIFSERIRAGFAREDWFQNCRSQYHENLCGALENYLKPEKSIRNSRRRTPIFKVPLLPKNLGRLQAEPFSSLHKRFPKMSFANLSKFAQKSLESDSCPRNFSLALAVELENHADQYGTWALIDKLYAHGHYCSRPSDDWNEMTNLKVAYTLISRNRFQDAIGFLQNALKSETKREDFRTLYWLYRSYKKLKSEKEAQNTLDELFKKYPISWYTIAALHDEKRDPLALIKKRPPITDEYDCGDAKLNRHLNWLKFGLLVEEDPYDLIRYGEFIARRLSDTGKLAVAQNLARAFFKAKLYRLQILVLSQSLNQKPELFNYEHLELLFPQPYFETMKQHSGKIDTALLLGLARQESGFDLKARSAANAHGLLQLLPSTAKTLARKTKKSDLYDYETNIQLGSTYVYKLVARFDGSVEKALGSYNAGATVMGHWENQFSWAKETQLFVDLIPYRETRDYIPSILRNGYWYHRLFPSLRETWNDTMVTSPALKALLESSPSKAASNP
ncbi:MAG: lytic transglycosylase domain-containing protein [Proteobacteria bacterium]|nr:lytic transglycosylase domain-containing protein [Pseudomonadota bacterium]